MTPFIVPTKWSEVPKSVVRVMMRFGIYTLTIALSGAGHAKLGVNVDRYYFDHNATTPVSPEVLEAFVTALRDVPGNASSIHHFGQVAKQQLELARRQTSALLNCDPKELVLLSGGTEADNLAILGVVRTNPARPK